MLASIVIDAYTQDETAEIAYAVMRLCAPPNQKIFSRVGVYAFWDFDTREILYIGISGDLTRRIQEHNGIIQCDEDSCKRLQIQEYFGTHEKLGISLFLQSKMHDDGKVDPNPDPMIEKTMGVSNAPANAGFAEGMLLRQYRERTGALPKWNGNAASKAAIGAPNTMRGSLEMKNLMEKVRNVPFPPIEVDVLKGLVGRQNSVLVSRYTLRELVDDYDKEIREDNLHFVRMLTMMKANIGVNLPWKEAIRFPAPPPTTQILARLDAEGYLNNPVPFNG